MDKLFHWMICSLTGLIIAICLFRIIVPSMNTLDDNYHYIRTSIYFGSILTCVSLFQWLLIRNYLRKSWIWIVLNVFIGLLIMPVYMYAITSHGDFFGFFIFLISYGAIVGSVQSFYLKNHAFHSHIWIATSSASWFIGFVISVGTSHILLKYAEAYGLPRILAGIAGEYIMWHIYTTLNGYFFFRMYKNKMVSNVI